MRSMADVQVPGTVTETQQTTEVPATEQPKVEPVKSQGDDAGVRADQGSDAGKAGNGVYSEDDLKGLLGKRDELLSENRTLKDEKTKREQDEAVKRGEHEKVIGTLTTENEALKTDAEQWQAHLSAERSNLEKAAKKLSAKDQKLLPDLEKLSTADEVRRASELVNRLLGEASTASIKNVVPDVSPNTAKTSKTYDQMTPEEIQEARGTKPNGSSGSFWF